MQFGVCIPHYGTTLSVDELRTTVEKAEALGYHSVWVSDHIVAPSHFQAAYGPVFYDAFVTLSYAAAFSRKLILGTSVIVVPYRNPLVTAKMVATLDRLSEGRVILGVGAGGAPDEFAALGVPQSQRGRRTDEYLRLMIALWTEDPTDFEGRYFSFTNVRFEPKPHQKPHPPIWVGGRSDAALRRAVAVADAWHPTATAWPTLEERMAKLYSLAEEAGRENGPAVTIHQSIRLLRDSSKAIGGLEGERRPGIGTIGQVREDMQRYQELGVPVVVCNFAEKSFPALWKAMEEFADGVVARSY